MSGVTGSLNSASVLSLTLPPTFEPFERTIELQSEAFYRDHAVCTTYKNSFTKHPLSKIWEMIFGTPISPADEMVRRLPKASVIDTSLSLVPRILAATDRLYPKEARDARWKALFTAKWVNKPRPHPEWVSYKNHYIVENFLESCSKVKYDLRKMPQSELAFYTENAASFTGLEIDSHFHFCVTDALLLSLAEFIPDFRVLSITGSTKITPQGIEAIIRKSPNLERFQPSTWVTSNALNALSYGCRKLKSLDFRLLEKDVTLDQLKRLFSLNPDIETLRLGPVKGLTDATLVDLIKGMHSLKGLELFCTPSITPEFIDNLFRIRHLDSLTLNECEGFSEGAISDEVEYYSLSKLTVKDCCLTEAQFSSLKKKFPYLESAHHC